MGILKATWEVKSSYESNANVKVVFSLTNITDKDYYILPRYTPLVDFDTDSVELYYGEKRMMYMGAYFSYKEPIDSNFIKIGAGQTLKKEHNLSSYYEMKKVGQYSIFCNRNIGIKEHLSDMLTMTESIKTDVVKINVQSIVQVGIKKSIPFDDIEEAILYGDSESVLYYREGTVYSNGRQELKPSDLQSMMLLVHRQLKRLSQKCVDKIGFTTENSPQFKDIFNSYDKYNFIKDIMKRINGRLKNKVSYHLWNESVPGVAEKNKQGVVAFVMPYNMLYQNHIFLLNAFYEQAVYGDMDSQVATIYHELSHTVRIGKTNPIIDYEYGITNCRKLAKESPEKAVLNADNYAWFISTIFSYWKKLGYVKDISFMQPKAKENPTLIADTKRNKLYGFFEGTDNCIHVLIYDGNSKTWMTNYPIYSSKNPPTTNNNPAAVIFNDTCYVFYNSSKDHTLKYMTCPLDKIQPGSWSCKDKIEGVNNTTSILFSPSATIIDDKILLNYVTNAEFVDVLLWLDKDVKKVYETGETVSRKKYTSTRYICSPGKYFHSYIYKASDKKNSIYVYDLRGPMRTDLELQNISGGEPRGSIVDHYLQVNGTNDGNLCQYHIDTKEEVTENSIITTIVGNDLDNDFKTKGGISVATLGNENYALYIGNDDGDLVFMSQTRSS
ncbi:M35 family metallo-endopeptidase [Clostridium cellulovorans]|uniref:Lysine-specific metallo-endopeptidase domain-containing protein n=1 Tax=Clostridium cellulovorans (strain ATCC 35296 / DSM 3052 / OCM 3 / 743B) TaxID=573061 RepID=D9SUJ0_CLOC7|nr:M35 family metallo-endopeptidase [Clostridium cellulovorans]ADL52945.1 hypothetical protein Clocel_3259 [Clostridium cellulovorans 743B]